MKRSTLSALPIFLALLAGCGGDGGTGPNRVASLSISPAPTPTLQVGQTLQLSATLMNASGGAVTGRDVTWTSSSPGIATVSMSGLVTAVAPGTADITASAGGASETVAVAVAAALLDCSAPGALRSLNVGEVLELSAAQAAGICLAGGGGGAEFVAIPFFGSGVAGANLPLLVSGLGIIGAQGPPSPSRSPLGLSLSRGAELALAPAAESFHERLREFDRTELPRLMAQTREARARTGGPLYNAVKAAVPNVGDLLRINAQGADFPEGCTVADYRFGRVKAVGARSIIVADTANPAGGFSDADYRQFADAFDNLVYPVDTEHFGEPGDIDGNSRSIIFFTRAVNELTPEDADFVIGGFFYSRDLLPTSQCQFSNLGEYFYLLVPDPNGVVNGNERDVESVRKRTVAILGHEFQHLINSSKRVARGAPGEDIWLNEGLSHIAEELLFYRVSGLGPGQNIDIEKLRTSQQILDAFNIYQIQNLLRYISYLESPEANSPYVDDDGLAVRGAIWSFLRYAAAHTSGGDAQLFRTLVDSPVTGFANLQRALGTATIPLVADWTTSVYTDDAVPGIRPEYMQESWNMRSLVGALKNTQSGTVVYPTYPLQVRQLTDGTPLSLTLSDRGAAAFIRFGVVASGTGQFRVLSPGGAPLPSTVAVSVTRTK